MRSGLPLPKYHQVYLVLCEQLAEGRFADGVPGELHLAREFGVARVTVRRALEQLVTDGLIQRAAGRGTVALSGAAGRAAAAAPRQRARLGGLLENLVDMGLRTSVKVVRCETMPALDKVAQRLDIAPGTPVQKAVRVRSTREGPLSLITTHVPLAHAAGFGRRELARQPILLLLEAAGVRIGGAEQTISARLADASVSRLLQVDVGSALLAVDRLVKDVRGQPVQWLQGLYRPDRYQIEMQLTRSGDIDARVWVNQDVAAQFH